MKGPFVKICGVRSPEIARVAAAAGANLVGLIFVPGVRRQISLEQGREIAAAARAVPAEAPDVVGIFVNASLEMLHQVAECVPLDFIQLSGDEAPALIDELNQPVIKALRLPDGTTFDHASRLAETYLDRPVPAHALLLDTHVPGSYGGNGTTGDWELAARLAARYPIILAGGLSPLNVAAGIDIVRPLVVDVSSGVETDGVKDVDKVRAFIETVQRLPGLEARVERRFSRFNPLSSGEFPASPRLSIVR